ncbi:carbohydrate ABC transporter permease [Niallia nealsonii]|uniref:Sugar ABC transporter permease n=1 Tax=Niallia nealsonii TaxID=115979 RepID=A0A2N0YXE1_9BACI|nr:sugar ABC transporter permease [Niallia nealsonii]PKG21920.1 sugar ABC transporter permease [Niallia nealsonii]
MRTETQTQTEPTRGLRYNRKAQYLKKKSEPYLYLLPTILLMVILLIIPIYMVIRYSFYDNVILNKNPEFIGFENFKEILTDQSFIVAVKNTLIFVGGSVIAHMILGMTFAMLLNTKYLGKKTNALFRVIFALPWMFTASVIAVLWKMLLNPNGVINYFLIELNLTSNHLEWLSSRDFALLSVTMINIWAGYPFFMISILAGLQGISSDLYESSAIDGANIVKRFFYITLPQLKPILISLILLDFVWTIQQFALIWMTTGGGPINATEMLSTFIYKLGFSKYQYAMASTSAVILLFVCTIIAIFYVRHQRGQE